MRKGGLLSASEQSKGQAGTTVAKRGRGRPRKAAAGATPLEKGSVAVGSGGALPGGQRPAMGATTDEGPLDGLLDVFGH